MFRWLGVPGGLCLRVAVWVAKSAKSLQLIWYKRKPSCCMLLPDYCNGLFTVSEKCRYILYRCLLVYLEIYIFAHVVAPTTKLSIEELRSPSDVYVCVRASWYGCEYHCLPGLIINPPWYGIAARFRFDTAQPQDFVPATPMPPGNGPSVPVRPRVNRKLWTSHVTWSIVGKMYSKML